MEHVIEISGRETFILAVLVLFMGKMLTQKVGYLRRNNLPEPVTGGVLAALLAWIAYLVLGIELSFTLDARDDLLVMFFTTIGLSARLTTLFEGGRSLIILVVLAVVYLFLQNLVAVGVVGVLGFEPILGMLGGSISLSGGHGTAIAWAPLFREEYGLALALEAGLAAATFGLILGGVIGGPIAGWLIRAHDLKSEEKDGITVGFRYEQHERIEVDHMLATLLIIAVCMELGFQAHEWLIRLGIHLPVFLPCLLIGIVLTNTIPVLFKNITWWPTGSRSLALVSDISLGLFLAMSLMSLQLWQMQSVAGPLALVLVAQLVLIVVYCRFVIFRAMGENYEAAVMSAGYAGFALGATPTAVANMTAVSKQYGAAPHAFIVIPLLGAFFIDISNAFVIEMMLKLFG